jgi:hypothetical protein
VRLELLFRCRLRVWGRVKMTHAGRPELNADQSIPRRGRLVV